MKVSKLGSILGVCAILIAAGFTLAVHTNASVEKAVDRERAARIRDYDQLRDDIKELKTLILHKLHERLSTTTGELHNVGEGRGPTG